MLTFNKNYFGLFLLFFAIEVLIAVYVHDTSSDRFLAICWS